MTDGKTLYEIPGLDMAGEDVRIQRRAYQIWEEEGRPQGRSLEHWTRAEQDLRAESEQKLRFAEGETSSLSESD
ncbi:DUF2934 family protein [Roseiarcus fermentans]|uniref:DUF2934 family protein n=1 Tax=Roseiarcus fermentans TaxID=1473586 RepID=A0A366EXM1_9HYPH|nr:DUF2934 domain-containing protein [Roseiarcus fermentans]RBP06249.1 DUF2934 family protein [Roseiarcus fermentans]